MTEKEKREFWAEQEKEPILFIARNTTPTQRLEWLEEMIVLFSDIHNSTKGD